MITNDQYDRLLEEATAMSYVKPYQSEQQQAKALIRYLKNHHPVLYEQLILNGSISFSSTDAN